MRSEVVCDICGVTTPMLKYVGNSNLRNPDGWVSISVQVRTSGERTIDELTRNRFKKLVRDQMPIRNFCPNCVGNRSEEITWRKS